MLLKGTCWCRPTDSIGSAYVANGISGEHRAYLASGGYGFIIGDGALNYGLENIFETFYALTLRKGIVITTDFQEIINPAYNRDRGPVSIGTARFHIEF